MGDPRLRYGGSDYTKEEILSKREMSHFHRGVGGKVPLSSAKGPLQTSEVAMDRDMQDVFQPDQVTPELQRYLSIVASPQRRRKIEEEPKPERTAEEIWDSLGDFA